MLSPLLSLREKIKKSGGFVNAHAHLDRANTARYYNAEDKKLDLKEKWQVVDNIKRKTTYFEYKKRKTYRKVRKSSQNLRFCTQLVNNSSLGKEDT